MDMKKTSVPVIAAFALAGGVWLAGCSSGVQDNAETKEIERTTQTVSETESVSTETTVVSEPAFEWETEDPGKHGLDKDGIEDLHDMMKGSKALAMLTIKDGVIVDEFYNEGYDKDSTFPFHSCSKSVTGTLIGIAMEQGYIESIEDPISKYLPQAQNLSDTRKAAITIRDLLTNQSGLDWDEWNSYDVWTQFRSADNWVEFILNRELVYEPGTHFTYSTGNTHLLSAILQSAVGKNQLEYAREVLLDPLGMDSVSWSSDPQGITDGGNGIVMTVRDAARFGQMCLQGGVWQDERIVPLKWLTESTTAKNDGYGDLNGSYGYQWWMRDYKGYDMYYAYGFGGQYIFVVPELNLVNVITSNNSSQSYKAREYFTEYLPELVK